MSDTPFAFIPSIFFPNVPEADDLDEDLETTFRNQHYLDKIEISSVVVDEVYSHALSVEAIESGAAAFAQAQNPVRGRERITLGERKHLLDLVQKLGSLQGLDIGIDHETTTAARAFFRMLPSWAPPPRIAPDAEGSLLVIWGGDDAYLMLVLESWKIHLVVFPGTDKAEYVENITMQPDEFPVELQDRLNIAG